MEGLEIKAGAIIPTSFAKDLFKVYSQNVSTCYQGSGIFKADANADSDNDNLPTTGYKKQTHIIQTDLTSSTGVKHYISLVYFADNNSTSNSSLSSIAPIGTATITSSTDNNNSFTKPTSDGLNTLYIRRETVEFTLSTTDKTFLQIERNYQKLSGAGTDIRKYSNYILFYHTEHDLNIEYPIDLTLHSIIDSMLIDKSLHFIQKKRTCYELEVYRTLNSAKRLYVQKYKFDGAYDFSDFDLILIPDTEDSYINLSDLVHSDNVLIIGDELIQYFYLNTITLKSSTFPYSTGTATLDLNHFSKKRFNIGGVAVGAGGSERSPLRVSVSCTLLEYQQTLNDEYLKYDHINASTNNSVCVNLNDIRYIYNASRNKKNHNVVTTSSGFSENVLSSLNYTSFYSLSYGLLDTRIYSSLDTDNKAAYYDLFENDNVYGKSLPFTKSIFTLGNTTTAIGVIKV